MKGRELVNLGMKQGPAVKAAMEACEAAYEQGWKRTEVRQAVKLLLAKPEEYTGDAIFGDVAAALINRPTPIQLRQGLSYETWGGEIEAEAHEQMRNACRLPVAVAAALMPDAHVGYGLPIGGVLATDNAVIPYAVGVDIACRVMLTVFDIPAERLASMSTTLAEILEANTRFGMGVEWPKGRSPWHEVMDDDWSVTPVTGPLKETAWRQLGTSGSGNHFVEFGEISFGANDLGVAPGVHLALLSHSGSRGPGAKVAKHYSDLAMSQHPGLPKELRHLAWLSMDAEGAEYWAAMELMGRFASANHHVIHERIIEALGAEAVLQVENHHNFAWREKIRGRDVIVHRKGATPAGEGVLGVIPGSMADPGYLVRGRGGTTNLNSAAHGAGRRMSRTAARQTIRRSHLEALLRERGVTLLSAGLDESPHAYKNIDEVIAAQADLIDPIAKFMPRIVKMAPDGERAED